MKPSDMLLALMPSAQSLLELIRWLDAEGATNNLSLYVAFDRGARGVADAIVDAIHSEEATSVLVERLCELRPRRAPEIRRDLTFAAIKQERGAEVAAPVKQTDRPAKPEFYVMLRDHNGTTLVPRAHEQDALRMAETELRVMAPHRRAPGTVEVGRLVPTAGVVPNPGRYVDGIPFPFSIQSIEGDPAPDELVHAREVAARRDAKLRALRQGLRDVLAEMGEEGYVSNDIKARLTALLED